MVDTFNEVDSFDPWSVDSVDEQDSFDNQGAWFSQEIDNNPDNLTENVTEPEQEDSGDTNVDSEKSINVTYFLANALKEKGILPLDEIPEDIKDEDVLDAYRYAHEERIRQDIETSIAQTLQARGITDDHLEIAMAIQNGFDPSEIRSQNIYKTYSEVSDDADQELKERVIREYHKTRGLLDDEIEDRMLDLELNEEKFETDFNRAKSKFKEIYQEFQEQNHQLSLQRERAMMEQANKNRQILHNIETNGVIANEKLSPTQLEQFKKALYNQDEIVEISGQPYKATKFDLFLYDFQNNLETQLLAFKMLHFRELDKEILKSEGKAEAEETIFKNLQSRLEKSDYNKNSLSNVKKGVDGRTYHVSPNAKVIKI